MCGDLDENNSGEIEQRLYARFLADAQSLLAPQLSSGQSPPADLSEYMEKLFSDSLGRAVRDGEGAAEAQRYARLAMQPIVFARIAGFLAGHCALSDDPLRKVIDALMLGYGEAEAMDRTRERAHQHGDVVARG